MDKLDKIAIAAITALLLWISVLVFYGNGDSKNQAVNRRRQEAVQRYQNPNLSKEVRQVKDLLASASLGKAAFLIEKLIKQYPFEGMPYMLKGDLLLHKQDVIGAMLQYKEAVDLNPDFLDKKTKSFQGKKIKKTVGEAQRLIEKSLTKEHDRNRLQKNKKILYYMLRKIAGGCS